jgi:hypothetical protein
MVMMMIVSYPVSIMLIAHVFHRHNHYQFHEILNTTLSRARTSGQVVNHSFSRRFHLILRCCLQLAKKNLNYVQFNIIPTRYVLGGYYIYIYIYDQIDEADPCLLTSALISC